MKHRDGRCAVRNDQGIRCGLVAGHLGEHLAHYTPLDLTKVSGASYRAARASLGGPSHTQVLTWQ